MFKPSKSLTLIELLVVIAVVSSLSSFVAIFLQEERNKAADASVRDHLFQIKVETGVYSLREEGYSEVCSDPTIRELLGSASGIGGGSGEISQFCASNINSWAVMAPLKSTNDFWCLDSFGFVGEIEGRVMGEGFPRCSSL